MKLRVFCFYFKQKPQLLGDNHPEEHDNNGFVSDCIHTKTKLAQVKKRPVYRSYRLISSMRVPLERFQQQVIHSLDKRSGIFQLLSFGQ